MRQFRRLFELMFNDFFDFIPTHLLSVNLVVSDNRISCGTDSLGMERFDL